jgi:hypothetical protein
MMYDVGGWSIHYSLIVVDCSCLSDVAYDVFVKFEVFTRSLLISFCVVVALLDDGLTLIHFHPRI